MRNIQLTSSLESLFTTRCLRYASTAIKNKRGKAGWNRRDVTTCAQLQLNPIDQSIIISHKIFNATNRLMVPKYGNLGECVLIFITSMNKLHESTLITQTTMNEKIATPVWGHLSYDTVKASLSDSVICIKIVSVEKLVYIKVEFSMYNIASSYESVHDCQT